MFMAFHTARNHRYLRKVDWANSKGGHNDSVAYKQILKSKSKTKTNLWISFLKILKSKSKKKTKIKKQTFWKSIPFWLGI